MTIQRTIKIIAVPKEISPLKRAQRGLIILSAITAIFFSAGSLLTGYSLGQNHTFRHFTKVDTLNLISINGLMVTLFFITTISFLRVYIMKSRLSDERFIGFIEHAVALNLDKSSKLNDD